MCRAMRLLSVRSVRVGLFLGGGLREFEWRQMCSSVCGS
jgi:hypothetical protein